MTSSPSEDPRRKMRASNATADELVARALEALALAEQSSLPRVRDMHTQAAARWLELAEMRARVAAERV
jgi:hypothetical protein